MAKRSAKRRQSSGEFNSGHYQDEQTKVRALFPGTSWSPDDKEPMRDQRYVKNVKPRSEGQAKLMKAIDTNSMVMALGPAGTGKTYLAVAKAVEQLERGDVSRIVLSRPAVEAGESIGFLPGAMEEKLAPYLRPLYDALSDRLSPKRLKALMAEGLIEIGGLDRARRDIREHPAAGGGIEEILAVVPGQFPIGLDEGVEIVRHRERPVEARHVELAEALLSRFAEVAQHPGTGFDAPVEQDHVNGAQCLLGLQPDALVPLRRVPVEVFVRFDAGDVREQHLADIASAGAERIVRDKDRSIRPEGGHAPAGEIGEAGALLEISEGFTRIAGAALLHQLRHHRIQPVDGRAEEHDRIGLAGPQHRPEPAERRLAQATEALG